MDESERHRKSVELGRQLVARLLSGGGDDDIITRWMGHYLARKMVEAETAEGEARVAAERECEKTILRLWERRNVLPSGARPFETVEPILRALEWLDPENEIRTQELFWRTNDPKTPVEEAVALIKGIDHAACVIIEMVLADATNLALDEPARAFLEAAVPEPRKTDIEAIRQMMSFAPLHLSATPDDAQRRLQERIDQLGHFIDLASKFRDHLLASASTNQRGT